MAYPTTLDDFTNPISSNPLNSPSHSEQHQNINDSVEALEAKVGADSSAVTSSHDYKIAALQTGKQDNLGFTPEDVSNKKTSLADNSDTFYPTQKAVKTAVDAKQDAGSYATLDGVETLSNKTLSSPKISSIINTGTLTLPTASGTLALISDLTDKEDKSNKSTDVSTDATSDTKYPSVKAVKTYADTKADKPNEVSITTASSITPTGNYKENEHYVTALTQALTINAPSSPSNGHTLLIRINSAAAQTLTFNAVYDFIAEKPTETPAGETLYIGAIYNSTKSKWEVTSVNNK